MYRVALSLCVWKVVTPTISQELLILLLRNIKNISTLFTNEFIINFIVTKYFELKQKS